MSILLVRSNITLNPDLDGVAGSRNYPNGFTASVIRHRTSYGGNRGLFEVACFIWKRPKQRQLAWRHVAAAIRHRHPKLSMSSEVTGWLTQQQADDLCVHIGRLPHVLMVLRQTRKIVQRHQREWRRNERFKRLAEQHVSPRKRRLFAKMVRE